MSIIDAKTMEDCRRHNEQQRAIERAVRRELEKEPIMTPRKSESEINAEKAAKSRPDLLPASAILGAGQVMGYGFRKHGDCTWRVHGTEQADPSTHIASAHRHILEYQENPDATEEGSGLPVLYHALSQLAIAIDCIENPAGVAKVIQAELVPESADPTPRRNATPFRETDYDGLSGQEVPR